MKLADSAQGGTILINLSGRGDKDLDFVAENYGMHYGLSDLL
jgi:tryptophan synthase beta chain